MQTIPEQYSYWYEKAELLGLRGSWRDAFATTATRAHNNMPTHFMTVDELPVVMGGKLIKNPNYERDAEYNIHTEY